MENRKNFRYILGLLLIAAAAGLLAVTINLLALFPGAVTLLPGKLMRYTLVNALIALVPVLVYTVWYIVCRLLLRRTIFSSYHSNRQKQPFCILLAFLLCSILEIIITSRIGFPSAAEQMLCGGLSTIVYTASAAGALTVGHPF